MLRSTRYLLLALLVGGCDAPSGAGTEVRVGAAASLRDLCVRIRPELERAHPRLRIVFAFDASSAIARQIEAGAGYDLILSADAVVLDRIADRLVGGATRPFVGNRLVMVGAHGSTTVAGPGALAGADGPLAIAGPEVPAGRYARRVLAARGLLEALEPRMTNARNVRTALAQVESGAAGIGFVYRTDALASGLPILWAVSGDGPEVRYVIALIAGGREGPARALAATLGGPVVMARAAELGFDTPPGG